MLKKSLCTILILVFLFMGYSYSNVRALSLEEISAPSAVLMESETGKVIFEKNSHEVRTCASLTKVMTALLIFEAIESGKIKLDDQVTASANAASMRGSDVWIVEGESMTVSDMIKAILVASADDASVAMAEHISGAESDFVLKMNQRAQELNMKETVFRNCTGKEEKGHVTSAYDVALVTRELSKHEKVFEYASIWLDYLRNGETQIVNTNKLLKSYKGITGLKTGTTAESGSCITATAKRDGLSMNAVVLGARSGTDRFKDAASLLDFGFANYQSMELEFPKEGISAISVESGMETTVKLECDVNRTLIVPKGSVKNISTEIELPEKLTAPVKKGQNVGKVLYKIENETVAEFPVTAAADVNEMKFKSVLYLLFTHLLAL